MITPQDRPKQDWEKELKEIFDWLYIYNKFGLPIFQTEEQVKERWEKLKSFISQLLESEKARIYEKGYEDGRKKRIEGEPEDFVWLVKKEARQTLIEELIEEMKKENIFAPEAVWFKKRVIKLLKEKL